MASLSLPVSPRSSPRGSPLPPDADIDDDANPTEIMRLGCGAVLCVTNSWWKVQLNQHLDLMAIARKCPNCEYNYLRYPERLVMRSKVPHASANIFATGKMMIMGVTSEAEAIAAAIIFTESIRARVNSLVAPLDTSSIELVNCVGKADVQRRVNLDAFFNAHPSHCRLDRERFSALTYRSSEVCATINIFHTGTITFTKTKSPEEIKSSFLFIHELLLPHFYD